MDRFCYNNTISNNLKKFNKADQASMHRQCIFDCVDTSGRADFDPCYLFGMANDKHCSFSENMKICL